MSSNYYLVEGQWKDFIFRRIYSSDYTRVMDHINEYFFKEETTCKLLGCNEIFLNQMGIIILDIIQQGLSFLVEHKGTGELAAVRMTLRQPKASSIFDQAIPQDDLDWRTDAFLNSIDLTDAQKSDIYSKYGVDEYVELFIVATNPKFRNQGICSQLYSRSMAFLKAEGVKLLKCILTSPASRRGGDRFNFQTYSRIDYKTLTDKNGHLLFPNLIEDHFALITLKSLT